jgi:Zn-dependent protease
MDSVLGLVAIVFGIFVSIHAFPLILVTSRLVKFQFWAPKFTVVAREEALAERPALDAARSLMEQQGFRYVDTRRVRAIVAATSMLPMHSDVYYHPEHDVRAEVHSASMPTPRWPFDISLWNTYTDGSALLTVNGLAHHLLTYPAGITIADAYAPNFALQLAHHLKQRESIYRQRTDPADAVAVAQALNSAMLPAMVSEGRAYRRSECEGEPVYGLRLLAALKAAWQMRTGMRRSKDIESHRNLDELPPEAPPEARQAAERITFVNGLSTLNGLRAPRWFRWSAFVVSGGAFVALGTWWWGISGALVIGAVIALHEAGHWLAMRLANFRDVQVFFVPGFGAATSGEKHDASPLTHLVVDLAGPVPGMLLAMGCFAWMLFGHPDTSAWWYPTLLTATVAAFVINVINLAPVMPLDGGRVVDLFVMGRLPWFRFAFALASGAFLVWLGFKTGEKIISGLGLLSLLALPHQYRMALASRDLLQQTAKAPLASGDFGDAAARLYDFLNQAKYQHWNFEVKMSIGQNILPRFLGRLPNFKETLIGLLIYIAAILAPLALLGALAIKEPLWFKALAPFDTAILGAEKPHVPWRKQAEARLAASTQRMGTLSELIEEAGEAEEREDELHFAKILYAEASSQLPSSTQHASAMLKLSIALSAQFDRQSVAQAAQLLKNAQALLRSRLAKRTDSADALLLADVLDEEDEPGGMELRLAIRNEVVDLHAAHWERSGSKLPARRTFLAHALDEAGMKAEAEKQLQLAANDVKRLTRDRDYSDKQVALKHAAFLLANKRPKDARQRLASQLASPIDSAAGWYSAERQMHLFAAVAAREQGDWQEVRLRTSAITMFQTPAYGKRSEIGPRYDFRAGLLLADAERKLGRGAVADKLIAAMRPQYQGKQSGVARCHFGREKDSWRKFVDNAVVEIEKREFTCQDPQR